MPEKPKALSPSTATTKRSVQVAAAMAYPKPTPMVPHVPASSLNLPSTAGSSINLRRQTFLLQSCEQDHELDYGLVNDPILLHGMSAHDRNHHPIPRIQVAATDICKGACIATVQQRYPSCWLGNERVQESAGCEVQKGGTVAQWAVNSTKTQLPLMLLTLTWDGEVHRHSDKVTEQDCRQS